MGATGNVSVSVLNTMYPSTTRQTALVSSASSRSPERFVTVGTPASQMYLTPSAPHDVACYFKLCAPLARTLSAVSLHRTFIEQTSVSFQHRSTFLTLVREIYSVLTPISNDRHLCHTHNRRVLTIHRKRPKRTSRNSPGKRCTPLSRVGRDPPLPMSSTPGCAPELSRYQPRYGAWNSEQRTAHERTYLRGFGFFSWFGTAPRYRVGSAVVPQIWLAGCAGSVRWLPI